MAIENDTRTHTHTYRLPWKVSIYIDLDIAAGIADIAPEDS